MEKEEKKVSKKESKKEDKEEKKVIIKEPSMIEKANQAAERLEKANQNFAKLIEKQEKVIFCMEMRK